MAVSGPVEIDRQRIRELIEREEARLNERTPASGAMYERAQEVLSAGVASSYQLRPVADLPRARRGPARVGRRRQREARLPQRLRPMVQATPIPMMNLGVVLPERGYLEAVREITRRRFGVEPDMVTLAKSLGGGLPTGAIGGTEEVMAVVSVTHSEADIDRYVQVFAEMAADLTT